MNGEKMKTIYDYTYEDLIDLFASMGYKKYRADQLFKWLYRKRVTDFSLMSDLSKEMIAKLKENFYIMSVELVTKQVAKDKTAKYLFKLHDGALVETVLMHFDFGHSVCVSSQVGCNMGCKFCASGLLKKQRDLTAGEMYLVASDKVPKGEVYSTETLNGFFDDGQATGKNITVRTSNIYADSETELSVGRIMNGKTMESLMGIDDYDMYSGAIFVNPNDMARIAGDAQYQYSAYVKDLKDVDNALKSLNEMGYNPLSLKGAVYVDQISEAMFNIVQVPVILFLLVAVFFISYFVVKLILRSRSDYFVILRILGMNGKNTKRLLDIELMTVATVAYLIFIAVYIIAKNGFFGNSFIATLASMLSVPQLAVLYLIIILMVYLISAKFAKSMFKKSAMDTFREEA